MKTNFLKPFLKIFVILTLVSFLFYNCKEDVNPPVESFTIQQRLNKGETPSQIYNSDTTLLDSLYGKTYQGGLIFYLNTTNGTGLVAAPSNQSTGAEWGCRGTEISGADGTAIGTGAQNTIDIEADCTTLGTAADICANLTLGGFSDWFLPSKDELNKMYINLKMNGFGGFLSYNYWSSTEGSSSNAWIQNFNYDYQGNYDKKGCNIHVRCVRSF